MIFGGTTKHDGSGHSFAGLWHEWNNVETGEAVRSCTIIVTGANAMTWPLHERMPVILEQFEPWLSGAAGHRT